MSYPPQYTNESTSIPAVASSDGLECPNCGENANSECACKRNKCIDCGGPVGNVTFTVCDQCWPKRRHSNTKRSEPTTTDI